MSAPLVLPNGSTWEQFRESRAAAPAPKPFARVYPPEVRAAAVAAYGKKSMSVLAAELGASTGAISHWWAQARRDGTVKALFGRHNGARVLRGRVSKRADGTRVEPAVSRDALKAHRRDQRIAARATAPESRP